MIRATILFALLASPAWAAKDQTPVGVTIAVCIAFVVLVLFVNARKDAQLSDPSNTTTIYVAQLPTMHQLRDGPVVAALIRQSGNTHRELGEFTSAADAIREVTKSMNRAGIDAIYIRTNTSSRLEFTRLHHSHGGKAEGQKLGGAVIIAI
jgi:hypothetical protein